MAGFVTVKLKLARGTFTCEVDGIDYAALLLSREDEPGVAYPLVDTPENALHVLGMLDLHGLEVFNDGMWGTDDFEENPEAIPYEFEVCITAPGSDAIH